MIGQELRKELERIWRRPGVQHATERNRWVWGQRPVRYNTFLENMVTVPVAIPGPSLAPRKRKPLKWPK